MRPGYAESSDVAAHQTRQWGRAVALWLGLSVLSGVVLGGATFVLQLDPEERALLDDYALAVAVASVAPGKLVEVEPPNTRGPSMVPAAEAARRYPSHFGGRTLGFLVRQLSLGVLTFAVLALAGLALGLRWYREVVFGSTQRRGATLRDIDAEARARRRRQFAGFVGLGVAIVGAAELISLGGPSELRDYVVATAVAARSPVGAFFMPAADSGLAWFTSFEQPGFRPATDVLVHLRDGPFRGLALVEVVRSGVLLASCCGLGLVASTGRSRAAPQHTAYAVAGVELPAGKECYHLLCCGSPGSGKSTAIKDLLDQIRARGARAIVYDLSGEYVELYYREGTDRLLNPADARSAYWTPWAEGDAPSSYAALAQSLFPPGGRDPFWARAAGALFAATLEKLGESGATTNVELDEVLTLDSIEELAAVLQNTRAARYFDENAAAMQASVIATVATGLQGWRLLADQERHFAVEPEAFSIRRFVRGEGEAEDSWLFLSTTEADAAAMRPLLSLWADIASTALLSLPQAQHARIWAVLDEVASLQRLPALPGLLERGRKHGAAVVLGLQAMPQLREAYGRDQAAALAAQPQTWLVLRSVEPDTAKWLEGALGMVEREEARTSLSMGAEAIRDGTSYQQQVVQRPLVLASEITTLPDFQGFLKMPGSPDVYRVRYAHKHRAAAAAAFVGVGSGGAS